MLHTLPFVWWVIPFDAIFFIIAIAFAWTSGQGHIERYLWRMRAFNFKCEHCAHLFRLSRAQKQALRRGELPRCQRCAIPLWDIADECQKTRHKGRRAA
jgi:hypothetical protein